jgi:hypothetical protein
MRNIITLSQLKVAGACADALRRFATAFGESTPVTLALACKHADQFDWDWAALYLLPAPARAEYGQDRERAQGEYDRDHEYARVEYARAEYDRAVAPALSLATYTEACARAQTEYARACARAWATLYTRGGYNV